MLKISRDANVSPNIFVSFHNCAYKKQELIKKSITDISDFCSALLEIVFPQLENTFRILKTAVCCRKPDTFKRLPLSLFRPLASALLRLVALMPEKQTH